MLHKLISAGQVHGSLYGHGDKAVYIPDVYVRMQNKWSDSFLASNGYLGKSSLPLTRKLTDQVCMSDLSIMLLNVGVQLSFLISVYSVYYYNTNNIRTCTVQ